MSKISRELKNEIAAEFKKRYSEVSTKAKAVKAKLKETLKDVKVLSKDAKALYDFANDRMYSVDDEGMFIPAFKGLDGKMDQLETWIDCWIGCKLEIDSVINDL